MDLQLLDYRPAEWFKGGEPSHGTCIYIYMYSIRIYYTLWCVEACAQMNNSHICKIHMGADVDISNFEFNTPHNTPPEGLLISARQCVCIYIYIYEQT